MSHIPAILKKNIFYKKKTLWLFTVIKILEEQRRLFKIMWNKIDKFI